MKNLYVKRFSLLVSSLLSVAASNIWAKQTAQKPIAYVLRYKGIDLCEIDQTGNLSRCKPAIDTTGSAINPVRFTLHNNYAYITFNNDDYNKPNFINKCSVGDSGNLYNCIKTGPDFTQSSDLTFYNSYVYLSGDSLTVCSVDTQGNLNDCNNAYVNPSNTLVGKVTIRNGYAYFEISSSGVKYCAIGPNGSLRGCTYAVRTITPWYQEVVINEPYAYISTLDTDGSINISKCSFADDGTMTDCTGTAKGLVTPFDIAFYNNNAYIAANKNNVHGYWLCPVNQSDGSLINCKLTGNGFYSAAKIAFSDNYAYVVNVESQGYISKCSFGNNGDLTNCQPSQFKFRYPGNIVFN